MSKQCCSRLLAAMLVLLPAVASAQEERAPAIMPQDRAAPLPPTAVLSIQDAIAALNARGRGKSAPAQPLGDPAEFFGPENYPPAAVRDGQEGRAVVRVELDARGYPTGCTVLTSSGATVLDEATCRIAQTRMQFAPARDLKGKPTPSQYTLPVRWVLPKEPAPEQVFDLTDGRKAVVDLTVELALDADGKVTSCRVVEQLPEKGDACTGFPLGKASALHAVRNGEASASRMTMITRVYLDQP